jgi:hypothetical protein
LAGRKVFTAGEVLQAADVNDYLMDQSVMVFAGTAARGSAIPSPSEGMVTYRSDDDVVEVFDGSVFAPVGVEPAILQVVSTAKTDNFSSSSQSFTEITGLTATITPSATSSKVLVLVTLQAMVDGNSSNGGQFRLQRGSTDIGIGDAAGSRTRVSFGNMRSTFSRSVYTTGLNFLDSPATTSATTYSVEGRVVDASTFYVNQNYVDGDSADYSRAVSSITLMEVAG